MVSWVLYGCYRGESELSEDCFAFLAFLLFLCFLLSSVFLLSLAFVLLCFSASLLLLI